MPQAHAMVLGLQQQDSWCLWDKMDLHAVLNICSWTVEDLISGAKHRLSTGFGHCSNAACPLAASTPALSGCMAQASCYLRCRWRWLVQCLADKLSSSGAALAHPTLLMRLGSLALMRCT